MGSCLFRELGNLVRVAVAAALLASGLALLPSCALAPGQSYTCASDADCLGGSTCQSTSDGARCQPNTSARGSTAPASLPDGLPPTQWVLPAASTGAASVLDLAVDGNGNTFALGDFGAGAGLVDGWPTPAGMQDVFMLAVDAAGGILWTQRAGGGALDEALGLALDPFNNLFTLGTFGMLGDVGLQGEKQLRGEPNCAEPRSFMLLALGSAGQTRAVRTFGGAAAFTGRQHRHLLAPGNRGGVVFAVRFQGAVDLGTGPLARCGQAGVLLASLDEQANVRFARVFLDAPGEAVPLAVAVAADGRIAVGGVAVGTVDLGPGALSPVGDAAAQEGFLALFDASGNPLHQWRISGTHAGSVETVAFEATGTLGFAGLRQGAWEWGASRLDGEGGGAFVAALDAADMPVFARALPELAGLGPLAPMPDEGWMLAGSPGPTINDGRVSEAPQVGGSAAVFLGISHVGAAGLFVGRGDFAPLLTHALVMGVQGDMTVGGHTPNFSGLRSLDPFAGVRLSGVASPDAVPLLWRMAPLSAAPASQLLKNAPLPNANGDSPPHYDAPSCSTDRWCWFSPHPEPVHSNFHAMHGLDTNTVWVAGDDVLLTFNGQRWTRTGKPAHPALGIWAVGRNDAVTVGGQGMVLRWDGAQWKPLNAGTTETLRGVWARDATQVWAVGDHGTVRVLEGTAWTSRPLANQANLHAVHGDGAGDVTAVGEGLTVVQWGSVSGERQLLDGEGVLRSVWEGSYGGAWAAGERRGEGVIFHRDGDVWTQQVLPGTPPPFTSIWQSGAQDVWAVGVQGAVYKFDGRAWGQGMSGVQQDLHATWAASSTQIFVAGAQGTLRQRTSTGWQDVKVGSPLAFTSVTGADTTWISSDAGMHRYINWWVEIPLPGGLGAVSSLGRNGVAVGGAGLYVNDGIIEDSVWRLAGEAPSGATSVALARDRFWAAANGRLQVRNNGWHDVETSFPVVHAVARVAEELRWHVVAVGEDADGHGSWQFLGVQPEIPLNGQTAAPLRAVCMGNQQDTWAVGDQGTVLQINPSGAVDRSLPIPDDLRAVVATSAGDVVVVGRAGTIRRYMNGTWRQEESGTQVDLNGVAVSRDGLMVVGDEVTVLLKRAGTAP